MKINNDSISQKRINLHASHIIWLSIVILFMLHLFRSAGIYPVVFADEWAYSSYSRLYHLQDAGVPSYLYLYLFRITNLCGDGFLDCARAFNGVFIVLVIPIIYAIARRFCDQWTALIVAILSVSGPINTYAIYFMPEAMYFFGFWLLTWFILARAKIPLKKFALLQGIFLGLLSMVKIHALFILPSLMCYAAYHEWRNARTHWLSSSIIAAILTLISFASTKIFLGYLFAGRAGLTIFGSLYGAQSGAIGKDKEFLELIISAFTNLSGHFIALTLMFGLPIAVILSGFLYRWKERKSSSDFLIQDLVVYCVVIIVPLLIITAYFTASVAGSGPYENLGRLHMRYYNFALPLFYILAATQLKVIDGDRGSVVVAAILVVLAAGYGALYLSISFTPSMVDSPELRGFTRRLDLYRLLVFLGIASIIAWVINPRKAAKFFVYIFFPLVVVISSWQLSTEVRSRQVPDEYDEAGQFAKRYLGASVAHLTVVAPSPAGVLRTLFHIDNIQTQTMQLAEGSSIDVDALPSSVNWLLMIGDYNLTGTDRQGFSFGKYVLFPIKQTYQIDFNKASWQGVLSRVRGLSSPEDWGTWSIGPEVRLEFLGHLPKRFRLTMQATAFGSNVHEKFRIVIGSEERSFYLKSTPQMVSFNFSLSANERVIRLFVPHPTSPQSIGLNDDTRQLGIGISQMLITPIN